MTPLLLLALFGCDNQPQYPGAFDLPVTAGVLQPEVGGPFAEPIGYVASQNGGQISLLALKQGRFLTDHQRVSFARGAPLATGNARLLSGVAPYALDAERVDVFAADRAFRVILRMPHVTGLTDGVPERAALTVSEPAFADADASGDALTLADLDARPGWVSTESWRLERVSGRWWLSGSRSGRVAPAVEPGEPWESADLAWRFTLSADGTDGDFFSFETDSGLVETDAGGVPLHLRMAPDQSVIALTVADDAGASRVRWLDPASNTLTDAELPAVDGLDSRPGRLAWTPDAAELFVADTAGAWRWRAASNEWALYPLPWPVLDVAPLLSADAEWLYVARADRAEVWLLDLRTGALIDANPHTPGVDGRRFVAPITGIEAVPVEATWPQLDADGEPRRGRSVAISLNNAQTFFMEEGSTCLVRDVNGPRTDGSTLASGIDYSSTVPSGTAAPPYLEPNGTNGAHVQVNPCGGVAWAEQWSLTWRENLQAWELEGGLSGKQVNLVYEDVRYVSDTGAVSFLMRSGGTPNADGWSMRFTVLAGVVVADGNNDEVPDREVSILQPGDPIYFEYLAGTPEDTSLRPYLLLTAQGADLAARVNPGDGAVEAAWF